MNITASDVQDAKLTATVTIPAADVDAAIKKAYKDAANKYRFPGFRAGRAPRPVIDNMLGKEATLAQATNDILAANEPAVLNELDIVPLKEGDYKELELVKDHEDYTYTVTFSLRQSVELNSYEPVEIEMPPAEVTEGEIDAQIEMLMGYHATFEEVDRPVQNDDYVTAAVKDIKGATRFAGENRMFVVGSENFPTEVNEGLVGMKKDESKEISWTLMGEDAEEITIEVTIDNVKERKLPELTDEFVKENFGFDTITAMREGVKEELEGDKTSKLPGLKENRAVAALSERLELEKVDEDYEQSVFSELGQTFLQNLSSRGMTLDVWLQASGLTSEAFIADLHRQANDVARESLALDALARHLEIEVSAEDVDKEFVDAGIEDVEASKAQFVADGRMPAVRDSIRRSKAVDWLVENAKVTEVDEYAKKDAE